jgi:predicted esterase
MKRTTLIALHGYTLNGEAMRAQLGPLHGALAAHVDVMCPDAPHPCDAASVDRLYAAWRMPRAALPHLTWWDSTDDGRVYRGWEATRDLVHDLVATHGPAGLLGFSQGAMLAATVAAAAARGEMPGVRFVVVVAGRTPRAEALQPLFDRPIAVPSLHVWGDSDALTGPFCPELVERFDPATREVARWNGAHVIPTSGPAADAVVDFVRRRSA